MSNRLSTEELAEIRRRWSAISPIVNDLQGDTFRLLAHIETQDEQLKRLEAVVKAVKTHVRWCSVIERAGYGYMGVSVGCQGCWNRGMCEAVARLKEEANSP